MSMLSIFNLSGSAISAQAQRLNVVASNLANVDAVAGPDGQPYNTHHPAFHPPPLGAPSAAGVRGIAISEGQVPGRRVHDPGHPLADAQGYVTHSNVNAVQEM